MSDGQKHQRSFELDVADAVKASLASGARDFSRVCSDCDGAPLRVVDAALDDLPVGEAHDADYEQGSPAAAIKLSGARHDIAEFLSRLPAANPEASQWWFDVDTVVRVVSLLDACGRQEPVLCLGTATVGYALAMSGRKVTIVDSDRHLLETVEACLKSANKDSSVTVRAQDLSHGLQGLGSTPFAAAVLDPPWYGESTKHFLGSSVPLLKTDAQLLLSIPPRLTRPTAERDRQDIVDAIVMSGCSIVSLERAYLGYVVPRFEEVAYANVGRFRGLPWRRGDLLHARRSAALYNPIGLSKLGPLAGPTIPTSEGQEVYARVPRRFRIFVRQSARTDLPQNEGDELPKLLESYASNVGSEGTRDGSPDVWTSEKQGLLVRSKSQLEVIRYILKEWEKAGSTREDAENLATMYAGGRTLCDWLATHLHLWSMFDERIGREAPLPPPRSIPSSFLEREHGNPADGYRDTLTRDRSRVVWSGSLRRLAAKTQVLPSRDDSELRQRLTHSTEVMQLAVTIARAMGLNSELVEAGALAHDLGHTPFGHAGEHAIHYVMATVHPGLFFNHYEHGVDVVRFLEGPYQHHPGHPGLNLTKGTVECIFKHTYFHRKPARGHDAEAAPCGPVPPPMDLASMWSRSKHKEY